MESQEGRWGPPNMDEAMRDQIDEQLSAAFRDVPVPAGLGPRLLARLGSEDFGCAGEADVMSCCPPVGVRSSRRGLMVVGGLLAAALVLFILAWPGAQRNEGFAEPYVLDEAIQLFGQAVGGDGQLLFEKPAPAGYPFSAAVLQVRGTKWRHFDGFLGRRGVAYDLPGRAGTSACLYVVQASDTAEFGQTPTLYPFTTAGCCASSWVEDGLLYVLVVHGDAATYRAYLTLPQAPVADSNASPTAVRNLG